MTAEVHVLVGVARAGKTRRLTARYREVLAAGGAIGRGVWLAPTYRAAEDVRSRLLEGRLRACFAPNCLTFEQFAEAVVRASLVPVRPLSAYEKRQIIRRLLDDAVRDERLHYFAPIAHTAGLVELVAELFADLKRQEIWPDQFERICRELGGAPKDTELVDLYQRYQRLLHEHHLYDEEGVFWSARDLLEQGQTAPFSRLSVVVVDGFTDFTKTQHEILGILARRVDELWISLTWEDPAAGRAELFHKPIKTLEELERRLPSVRRHVLAREAPASDATFSATRSHIERQLFCDPRAIDRRDGGAGVNVIAAGGELAEIEAIARRIKGLLSEGGGAGQARARPADIAVVFRSTAEAAPLVREVFAEFGIPFALDCRIGLDRVPALAALVSFLQLEFEDWPFRKLLDLLSNNYFQPAWPEWRNGRAAADAERMIRALQLPSGRRELLDALRRWSAVEQADRTSTFQRERALSAQSALALLDRLARMLGKLPESATAAEWATAVEKLAAETGMSSVLESPCDVPIAREGAAGFDAAAFDQLIEGLRASGDLDLELDGAAVRLDRPALLERIEQILKTEVLPAEHDEVGRVRIVSAPGSRSLDAPYLFVAGLAEKAFPAAIGEDRIYGAAECARMNEAGLHFVEPRERACEEMLLFYEVITRPTKQLTLSYAAFDEKAQPLSASPYLSEVERLFGPDAIKRDDEPSLSPIPRDAEPYCAREFRVKAVDMAIAGDTGLAKRLAARASQRESSRALWAAMRTIGSRASGKGFGGFEGMLAGAPAHDWLGAHFGAEHCWSTSQLEKYGFCPYQFFLERVLKLDVPEELSLDIDHMLRGRRVHRLLADVHRQLNQSDDARLLGECGAEDFQRLIAKTLADVMNRSKSHGPLLSAFDAIDNLLIARWIGKYFEQHQRYDESYCDFDSPLVPTHFEVKFGPAREVEEDDPTDSLSTDAAYVLTCNGMSIRLSGRIDRIDVGLVDGQVVFNVLDYKTSPSERKLAETVDGKALQIPLYAMVVQEWLLSDQQAVPWQGGYWHVRAGGFNPKHAVTFHEHTGEGIRPSELWTDLRERLVRRVASLVRGVQEGQFPMHCEDEHCTSRCEYRTVCRVHTVRSLEKTWQPPSTDEP
jgi:ATP-dependent helicase/DNAse subunit B